MQSTNFKNMKAKLEAKNSLSERAMCDTQVHVTNISEIDVLMKTWKHSVSKQEVFCSLYFLFLLNIFNT